jgi:hypothetical protein
MPGVLTPGTMGALEFESPDRDDSPMPGVLTPGTTGALEFESPDRDDSPMPGVITPGTIWAHWSLKVPIGTTAQCRAC